MNKRQLKKQYKKINERIEYFSSFNIMYGRQCGKSGIILDILRVIYDDKYKNFKKMKKIFKRIGLEKKLRGAKYV